MGQTGVLKIKLLWFCLSSPLLLLLEFSCFLNVLGLESWSGLPSHPPKKLCPVESVYFLQLKLFLKFPQISMLLPI